VAEPGLLTGGLLDIPYTPRTVPGVISYLDVC